MNEVADLSDLCRLCLDSSSSLISFDTTIHFSTKSIPELIKYCVDIESNFNDGGISPKNICQACLEKLQGIHEFKWKCHESDKYIKQIVSHSGDIVDEPDITPYNPPVLDESYAYEQGDDADEDALLQPMEPMDYNYSQPVKRRGGRKPKALKTYPISNRIELDGVELRKGQRHGMFVCALCHRSFKYVKPYKKHLKTHKNSGTKPLSYYKRRKQLLTELIGGPVRAAQVTAPLSGSLPKPKKKFKPEPQAEYDSISPYNSPAPFEQESVALHSNTRDSSPDFGDYMLESSRQLLNGADVDDDELLVETATAGRPSRNARKNEDMDYNPNGKRAKGRPMLRKPIPVSVAAAEKRRMKSTIGEGSESPPKRPGPASKTRGRPRRVEEEEEQLQIEGFSEVDISKMLQKKRDTVRGFDDDDESTSQPSHSNRSRSRSSSVELIPEIDIFGRS